MSIKKNIILDIILVVTPKFYKNYVFRNLNKITLKELVANRAFEPELLLLNKFVKKGDTVFDIGANIGQYSYCLEKIVGSKNVYAFEPIPSLFKNLANLFKNINLFKIAISDRNENAQFKIPTIGEENFTTRGKLDLNIIEPDENGFEIIEVVCQTLDSFIAEKKIESIQFIKIDIEGHELKLLKGAYNLLKEFKPTLLVEIEQRHHEFPIDEIFSFIETFGYEIKYYNVEIDEFFPRGDFNVSLNQDYSNLKTAKYINNFWCFPIN